MTEGRTGYPVSRRSYCPSVRPKGVRRGSRTQLLMSGTRIMGGGGPRLTWMLSVVTEYLQSRGSIAKRDWLGLNVDLFV